jgi:hypothetical protein
MKGYLRYLLQCSLRNHYMSRVFVEKACFIAWMLVYKVRHPRMMCQVVTSEFINKLWIIGLRGSALHVLLDFSEYMH